MSARNRRGVREGKAHAAATTSPKNNTPESLIAGVGASGALLTGAAVVFITLVGLVSFNVWPTSPDGSAVGSGELRPAASRASHAAGTPVAAASGQHASTSPSPTGAAGARNGERGSSKQPSSAATTAAAASSPSDTGGHGSSSDSGDGGGSDRGGDGGDPKSPPGGAGGDTGGGTRPLREASRGKPDPTTNRGRGSGAAGGSGAPGGGGKSNGGGRGKGG